MHRGKCVVVGTVTQVKGYQVPGRVLNITDFFFLCVNVSFLLAARVERECPRGAVGGALACALLA